MAIIDDLKASQLQSVMDRLRRVELAFSMGSTGIEHGTFRVGGTASQVFDSSGTLTINGTCTGSGAWTWTGPMSLSGTQTVTGNINSTGTTSLNGSTYLNGPSYLVGNVTVNGPTSIAGTLSVTNATTLSGALTVSGATTLNSNLTVGSGGLISVGSGLQLQPLGAGGGAINFLPSGSISAGLGKINLISPDLTSQVTIGASGTVISGSITNSGIGATSSAANVYVTAGGVFQKVGSAARFKIDPQPMTLADTLLDIPVKAWIDRGAHERGEPDLRIPGVIAEEVEAAGGEAFVGYDTDGRVESVLYDRLALARTQILADQLAETNQKLDVALELIRTLTVRFDNQSDNRHCRQHDI